MALDASELANLIQNNGLRQNTDGNGLPLPPSSQLQEYCAGLINALKAATVTFAPGTINGSAPPGGPLQAGTGTGGIFTGLTPAPFLAKTQVGAPGPFSAAENTAVITYLQTSGIFVIPTGGVTGICTATALSPGTLVNGEASGGKITAINGAACAAVVSASSGLVGPDMIKHYDIIMNYLIANLEVEFPTGSVTGSFSAGGGPLVAGAATGGKIS